MRNDRADRSDLDDNVEPKQRESPPRSPHKPQAGRAKRKKALDGVEVRPGHAAGYNDGVNLHRETLPRPHDREQYERGPNSEGDVGDPVLMIDEPTPFAPLSEWKEHLESLSRCLEEYGATPELREAIRVAEKAVADLT